MTKSPFLIVSLILILASSLAAQEEKNRHGGLGNDRSEGNSWGARDTGGDRENTGSDDQLKKNPSRGPANNSTVKKYNPGKGPMNPGGTAQGNGNRSFNTSPRGNIGKTWNGPKNTFSNGNNQGNHRSLHHFNNGNSQNRQGQERIQGSNPSSDRPIHARGWDGDVSNRSFEKKGPQSHSNGWGPSRHEVSPEMRRIGIKHIPAQLPHHNQILRADAEHSRFTPPAMGPKGQALNARLLVPQKNNAVVIQNHMKNFSMNKTFINQVNIYNSRENVANHYYWHTWNGTSYCHYYDPWGYHWYGWYWNGSCFWSRWYGGYWWWYDPSYSRWCYWNDGYWWWNDPYHVNVVYVYNDGDYVSSTSATVEAPTQAAEVDFKSRDGSRTVKVFGEDAFLYDTDQDANDTKPVYLASNVKEVKFSKPGMGKPMQIMLVLNDGSFEMFDSDGNPYNGPQDQP